MGEHCGDSPPRSTSGEFSDEEVFVSRSYNDRGEVFDSVAFLQISTKREQHLRLGPANLDDTLPFDSLDSDRTQMEVEESIEVFHPESLLLKYCNVVRPSVG